MITFLTSPKPFLGRDRRNQVRAIRSWLAVAPDVEVIVYGEAEGAYEICSELGVQYVPDVKSTESGLPYFNAIVEHAQEEAIYDHQVYVNCDILLNASLVRAIEHIPFSEYLLIGQRLDLDAGVDLNPSVKGWFDLLLSQVQESHVRLHGPSGKDYFAFRRGMWKGLPQVIIGRGAYDTALLAHCLFRRIPIVDGTYSVVALHQFHDYSHVPGGQNEVMQGKAAVRNRRNSGMLHSAPTVGDAQWVLRGGELLPNASRGDWLRALEIHWRFHRRCELLGLAIRALWRILTATKFYKPQVVRLSDVIDAWKEIARYPSVADVN
jgi:hypothetical protein